MRKRSVGINVRVSPTEKKRVTMLAKKCRLSLSEYLRQRALDYEPDGQPPKEVFTVLDKIDEMHRTRIPLPDICVSCISNADYLRITTCIPCGISTQPICCRKAPANRWRHPCWVMRIRHFWSAPTAIRRTWRNSRPQT